MILQNKITVFGATGKVGKELIKFLSSAEVPTIAVARNKSKTLEMPFVEWQQADLSEKNSLNKCLKNSTAVFLSSGFSRDFVKEQQNAVVAAKQAGVSHILRLSSAAADEISTNFIAGLSGETDQLLMNAGIHYTLLRPNVFMQNWLGDFSDTIKMNGKYTKLPGTAGKPT